MKPAPRRGGMLGGAMFRAGQGPARAKPQGAQGYPPAWSMLQGRMTGGAQALPPGVRVPMAGPRPPPPLPPPPQAPQGAPQTGGGLYPALMAPGVPATSTPLGMGVPPGMPPPVPMGSGVPPGMPTPDAAPPPTGGPLQAALMAPPGMAPRPPRQPMPYG